MSQPKKSNKAITILTVLIMWFTCAQTLYAQTTETIPAGSFIIDMGVVPQTISNGLKPYGLVYSLIINFKIPIKWIIAPGKAKDGEDFNYNGYSFKGGPFIILAQYRNQSINDTITAWQARGVVGITTTSPMTVPVAMTLLVSSVPRWTMDQLNGALAAPYFDHAGIPVPPPAYTRTPQDLGYCDDIFVMPHAYPQWSTHSNLYAWNKDYKGSIWLSCTAGSELEDMFNPDVTSQQTNFLSNSDATVPFPAADQPTTVENALVLYNNHHAGSLPYSYAHSGDQFMQFMGSIDAATQNGLEQIYIPKSPGWRTTTTIGVWDPDNTEVYNNDQYHYAAVVAYGRGLGDPTRGYVMLESGHTLSSAALPANIAAQRIFFNFSFVAGKDATVLPDVTGIPSLVNSGVPTPISFIFPTGINPLDFTVSFTSTCGGNFVVDPTDNGTKTKWIFTSPSLATSTSCPITVSVADACGRVFNTSKTSVVECNIQVTPTITSACNSMTNGVITMDITGAGGAYNWTWTRAEGGTASGTNPTSPFSFTGLDLGTYTVSITSGGGAGCTTSFTAVITSTPAITFDNTYLVPANVLCNGNSTGAITVTIPGGGEPPFTYDWGGSITTQNRSGLPAGNYSVIATDANNCSATASTTITETAPVAAIATIVTPAKCNGQSSGTITISVTGGTSPYSYLWNDGATSQNRTGLAAGTYSVVATDVNGCSNSLSGINITQPALSLSLSATTTDVTCFGGSIGSTINLTVGGGTLAYSYLWSNAVTTQNLSGIAAGTYTVTVTDANNCTAILSKTINQPTALTLSTSSTNQSCPGANDGTITLTPTGGTTGYTYLWNTTATTQNISGLTAGTYTVTVTDSQSCTANTSVTVGTTKGNPVQPASINN